MAKGINQRETIGKVLRHVRRHWAFLILSLVLALVYVAMSLYIPVLVGGAIDHIIEQGNVQFETVGRYLMGVLICALVAGISQWAMNELNNRITYRVTRDIRDEAFRHIQKLPISYLDKHPHGDLVSVLFRMLILLRMGF